MKAFVISFVFHVFILTTVVFLFSIPPAPKKTFFVFLGSLLPPQDFLFSSAAVPRNLNSLSPVEVSVDSRNTAFPPAIPKPSFHKVIARQKILFKTPLQSSEPASEENQPWSGEEGWKRLESSAPAYVPLRLYPR